MNKVLFLVGGVGSGKTTIGRGLAEMLPDATHISGGDVARTVASRGVELKRVLDEGEFLPSELMDVEMLNTIEATETDWVIVDGYPRYMAQLADVLYRWCDIYFTYVDAAWSFRKGRLINRGRGEDDEAREAKYIAETMPVIEWLMRNIEGIQHLNNNGNDGIGHLLPDIIIHHGMDT